MIRRLKKSAFNLSISTKDLLAGVKDLPCIFDAKYPKKKAMKRERIERI